MLAQLALVGLMSLASTAEGGWEVKAESNGVTVYSRPRAGSSVQELRSIGVIDAPPHAVLAVLADLEAYKQTMPYTEVSRVLATEEGGRVKYFYTVVNAPIASKRDYTLRIEDVSDWRDGKGYLKTRWSVVQDKGPAATEEMVRVTLNDGSWTLEPVENGTKTRATYDLFTDPGGSLPNWVRNKANSTAIPDVFEALRKYSKLPKYAGQKK